MIIDFGGFTYTHLYRDNMFQERRESYMALLGGGDMGRGMEEDPCIRSPGSRTSCLAAQTVAFLRCCRTAYFTLGLSFDPYIQNEATKETQGQTAPRRHRQLREVGTLTFFNAIPCPQLLFYVFL